MAIQLILSRLPCALQPPLDRDLNVLEWTACELRDDAHLRWRTVCGQSSIHYMLSAIMQ